VRAVIRKDRDTGQWGWDVSGNVLRVSGYRPTWGDALAAALEEMSWAARREDSWPPYLLAMGWQRPGG
jgi:hypothetical protein